MKIIIITQDEPFYLGKHFDYFFSKLPPWAIISGVILLDASPFGKADSFWKRVKRTYYVFGFGFFLRYCLKYIKSKIIFRKYLIKNVIKKYNINEIKLPKKKINAKECLRSITAFQPDLIINISASQIFKKNLLNLPKHGCLNLHSALLPKYKGLMPTFWALRNNESNMGVAVFFMDEGIDTGAILVQKVLSIEPTDSLESLINKNKRVGMDAIIEAINLVKTGSYETKKFSPGEGSYYSFPAREDVEEFARAGKKFW